MKKLTVIFSVVFVCFLSNVSAQIGPAFANSDGTVGIKADIPAVKQMWGNAVPDMVMIGVDNWYAVTLKNGYYAAKSKAPLIGKEVVVCFHYTNGKYLPFDLSGFIDWGSGVKMIPNPPDQGGGNLLLPLKN